MGIFTISFFERILKGEGAERVSDAAARRLAEIVEEKTLELCKIANDFCRHAGRKTILRDDVLLAKRKVLR